MTLKKKLSITGNIVIGLIVAMVPLFVSAGTGSSGGGDSIRGAFIAVAFQVVDKISKMDQKAVDVDVLKKTLNAPLKIDIVDKLIDTRTSKPVLDPALEAFGSPGYIQLKSSSPWLTNLANPKYEYLVGHELLRAAGYDDDGYVISVGILKLDQVKALIEKSEIVKFVVKNISDCVTLPAPTSWGTIIGAVNDVKFAKGWYFTVGADVTRNVWSEKPDGTIEGPKKAVTAFESGNRTGDDEGTDKQVMAICESVRSKLAVGSTYYPNN